MAGALPYMQLYPADYLADTAHLSTLEHGAYLLLMFNYWQRGESFKAKDEQTLNKRLAIVARLSNEEWEQVRDNLQEFFNVVIHDKEIEWRHERIERDLATVQEKSEKAKRAGKLSAESRRSKSKIETKDSASLAKDQQASNECLANVKQTLNHTEAEADTESDISTTTNGMFGKFPMQLDWRPQSDTWDLQIKANGLLATELEDDALDEAIREFISHWITQHKEYSQAKWEQKLAQAIVTKRRFTEASRNGNSNQNTRQNNSGIENTATDTSWRENNKS